MQKTCDCDAYATVADRLRIFTDGVHWFVDGIDVTGHYTEECWQFDSWQEAIEALPNAWREMAL